MRDASHFVPVADRFDLNEENALIFVDDKNIDITFLPMLQAWAVVLENAVILFNLILFIQIILGEKMKQQILFLT
jgi:hypothetical protein